MEKNIKKGVLYGVGVGPGDPEFLTLKAVRIIRESNVILLPNGKKEDCYAYQIVRQVLPEIDDKELLCSTFPMTKDEREMEKAHEHIVHTVMDYLSKGRQMAFLTIGDPAVYSTYTYIHEQVLSAGGTARMISGVPSFCAVAARLGISLGENEDKIHIIPATYDIRESQKLTGTRIYMKSGRRLTELIDALREESQYKDIRVYSVSNCGLPDETVCMGLDALNPDRKYLTTVIVKT